MICSLLLIYFMLKSRVLYCRLEVTPQIAKALPAKGEVVKKERVFKLHLTGVRHQKGIG